MEHEQWLSYVTSLVKKIKRLNYPVSSKVRLCVDSDGGWTVEEYCYLDGGGMGWELDSWGSDLESLDSYLLSIKNGGE